MHSVLVGTCCVPDKSKGCSFCVTGTTVFRVSTMSLFLVLFVFLVFPSLPMDGHVDRYAVTVVLHV